jgi:hypothetical protein
MPNITTLWDGNNFEGRIEIELFLACKNPIFLVFLLTFDAVRKRIHPGFSNETFFSIF